MEVLRYKDVVAKTGYCRSSIEKKVKRGEFPAPFSLGARAVGWDKDDVDKWLEDKKSSSTVN